MVTHEEEQHGPGVVDQHIFIEGAQCKLHPCAVGPTESAALHTCLNEHATEHLMALAAPQVIIGHAAGRTVHVTNCWADKHGPCCANFCFWLCS